MTILQDIRFGLRMLAKSPGFTIVAVLALGLGIGANSMMFTIYNAALFKSLPFEKPRQVVNISHRTLPNGTGGLGVSHQDFTAYREQARSFTGMAALQNLGFNISDEHTLPERADGSRLSAITFSVIGQKPILGRDFRPEDERPESEPVVILSYGLWQTRYAGDRSVIGKNLKINDQYHTIVGVMAEGMEFPGTERLWIPLIPTRQEQQVRSANLEVIGRLREDTSILQAQTEIRIIGSRLAAEHPETNRNIEPVVRPYIDSVLDDEDKQILATLLGAVTFVLLIACANVANLLLSRAVYRSRETSIRIAVGASRWRIVRQLLVESVLLSFLGGILGVVFATAGVRIFAIAVQPLGIPYWVDWSMDRTVFMYLFAICFATGILFGLAPALQISKTNVHDGLKETGRSTTGGIRSRKLTGALIIAEISLTLVLMIGGGLMIRSLLKRQSIDFGVRIDDMIAMQLVLGNTKYPQAADRLAFEQRLVEHLETVRDLESVTIASHIPGGSALRRPLKLADRDIADRNGSLPSVAAIVVGPGYFQALGLTMPRGREFASTDGAPGAEAAIVNQRFAAQYWPGEDPIGKKIQLETSGPWINVIGVSPTIRQTNLRQTQVEAMVYVPYRQLPLANFRIIARRRSAAEVVASALRDEVRKVDPDLPLFNLMTVTEYKNQILLETRILSAMFSIFAVIALILSAVGIYAVTAYATTQRTQELGVRMALGANGSDVVWLVLRLGLKQLAIGLPLGIIVALGMGRALRNALFQVTPTDPATFVSIPILLMLVIIVACLIPGWRAARVNPVEALRTE